MKKAYLAGGCFWGLEELFRTQMGVVDTEAGYCGGKSDDPTWDFHPGHAEALEITYDESITSFKQLLDFFFRIHDPTTVDRQGNDRGSAYRSAIFFQEDQEKSEAETMIASVDGRGDWGAPVVTTLEPFSKFWPAESYHQDYLQANPGGYTCHFIRPIESFL